MNLLTLKSHSELSLSHFSQINFPLRYNIKYIHLILIQLLHNPDWWCITWIGALTLEWHMLIFLVYKLINLIWNLCCGCCKRAALSTLPYHTSITSMMITTVVIEVILKIVPGIWAVWTVTEASCSLSAIADCAFLERWEGDN